MNKKQKDIQTQNQFDHLREHLQKDHVNFLKVAISALWLSRKVDDSANAFANHFTLIMAHDALLKNNLPIVSAMAAHSIRTAMGNHDLPESLDNIDRALRTRKPDDLLVPLATRMMVTDEMLERRASAV